jgi:hypothetical protein
MIAPDNVLCKQAEWLVWCCCRFRDVKEHHTRTVLPVAHITQGADGKGPASSATITASKDCPAPKQHHIRIGKHIRRCPQPSLCRCFPHITLANIVTQPLALTMGTTCAVPCM